MSDAVADSAGGVVVFCFVLFVIIEAIAVGNGVLLDCMSTHDDWRMTTAFAIAGAAFAGPACFFGMISNLATLDEQKDTTPRSRR